MGMDGLVELRMKLKRIEESGGKIEVGIASKVIKPEYKKVEVAKEIDWNEDVDSLLPE